ncbi:MAG: hypothetical protein M0011_00150 [Elusimicrobia bacterium]|nr:hypothetical protein [Elusimicrobiota bacterium]
MAKNKGVNAAAMAALLQLAAGSAGAAPAFVYLRGYPGDILYTDGSRTLDITPPGFARKAGNPSVSPDGKRLVFPANLDDNWDLYLGEFDGSRLAAGGRALKPRFYSATKRKSRGQRGWTAYFHAMGPTLHAAGRGGG